MAAIPSLQAHGPLMQPPGQAITSIMRVGHLPVLAYARSAAMFFLFRSAISVPCSSGSPTMFFTAVNTPPVLAKPCASCPACSSGVKSSHAAMSISIPSMTASSSRNVHTKSTLGFSRPSAFLEAQGAMNTVWASGCFLRAYSAT